MENIRFLTESGREKSGKELFNWIEEVQTIGVGEIIVTSIFNEGKRKGLNVELYKNLKKKFLYLYLHMVEQDLMITY